MSDPAPLELSEALPIGHLEAQLDTWVGAFPVDAIRAHLKELERQKGNIESAIESLNRRLAIWQAMRAHQAGQGDLVPTPSKRDAVLNLLERDPYREFTHAEIRSTLIESGLLEDARKARHALEMTLSNMTKRGEIERLRKGFYRFAREGYNSAVPTSPTSSGDEGRRRGGSHNPVASPARMERDLTRWRAGP